MTRRILNENKNEVFRTVVALRILSKWNWAKKNSKKKLNEREEE